MLMLTQFDDHGVVVVGVGETGVVDELGSADSKSPHSSSSSVVHAGFVECVGAPGCADTKSPQSTGSVSSSSG